MFDEYSFLEGDLLDIVESDNELLQEQFEILNEGLLFNKLPKEVEYLKIDIKNTIRKLKADNKLGIKDSIRRSLSSKTDYGLGMIYTIGKKHNLNIFSVTKVTTTDGYGAQYISFNTLCTYKDYILTLNFNNSGFDMVSLASIYVNYNKDKCQIPKNVVFDIMDNFNSSELNSIKCKNKYVKVSASSVAIDNVYTKLLNKYSDKYDVKKNFGGLSITVSVKE